MQGEGKSRRDIINLLVNMISWRFKKKCKGKERAPVYSCLIYSGLYDVWVTFISKLYFVCNDDDDDAVKNHLF